MPRLPGPRTVLIVLCVSKDNPARITAPHNISSLDGLRRIRSAVQRPGFGEIRPGEDSGAGAIFNKPFMSLFQELKGHILFPRLLLPAGLFLDVLGSFVYDTLERIPDLGELLGGPVLVVHRS